MDRFTLRKLNIDIMRDIKFRAWCEGSHDNLTFTLPQMEYDVTIQNGHYASVEGGWDIQIMCPTVPIMQFTGLKDANGVEIYEGDIVRFKDENTDMAFNREVFYNNHIGGWSVDVSFSIDKSSTLMLYVELFTWDSEVIGNIYENPELLKQ